MYLPENRRFIRTSESINKSLADIAKENQQEEYNSLISSIIATFTLLGILGSILGAFLLYAYLKDIDAIDIFPSSISNTSLIGFFFVYFLINLFIFIVTILPSIAIYINEKVIKEKEKHKIACIYGLPSSASLCFFLIFYCFEFDVSDLSEILFLVIIVLSVIPLFFIWGKNSLYKIAITFFFFIFIGFYSFLIIVSINKGQDDFFYFSYAVAISFSTIFINYLVVGNLINKVYFKKFISDAFFLALLSLFIPFLIYQGSESYNNFFDKKVKGTYSYRIMQAFGYADRNDKIYFIDQDFISREIKSNPQVVYEDIIMDKANIKNTYKAYCGRIYWRTDTIAIFQKYNDYSYKKIPNDKIFESQNNNFYCINGDIIKKEGLIKKEDLIISITNIIRDIKELVK